MVSWVPREQIVANDWNPNHVAVPELKLLALSIVEDGWTQPIVVRPLVEENYPTARYLVVDGFHRWTVAGWPEVAALTGGLVPVVELSPKSPAEMRLATIRHNRARGTHGVTPMASIVRELKDEFGLGDEEICRRLGMEEEELERLYDVSGMPERVRREQGDFNRGWVPTTRSLNEPEE